MTAPTGPSVRTAPGVRLLPNAVTVLALCSGLSGVQFTLAGNEVGAIAAIARPDSDGWSRRVALSM